MIGSKVGIISLREYKTTALTPAFLFGAVIFPVAVWAVIVAVAATGALNQEKPPLKGTIAVYDTTEGGVVRSGLERLFDPEVQRAAAEARVEELRDAVGSSPAADMIPEAQVDLALQQAASMLGIDKIAEVTFRAVESAEAFEAARAEVASGTSLMAAIRVSERTLALPPFPPVPAAPDEAEAAGGGAGTGEQDAEPTSGEADEPVPTGSFTVVHAKELDFDYIDELRRAVRRLVQAERYRRAGIDPERAAFIDRNPPRSETLQAGAEGEERSSEVLSRLLPIIFLMLLFVSAITSGQYLLMGTLEEKGSRVMEVVLSAASPMQLMIGKLLGQGLVGLTVLGIYTVLGVAAADRFNVLSLIPTDSIAWLVLYFLMAYTFFGAMNVAIGAAITEIREAQALYAPITVSMIVPFVLMFPVMDNPGSLVARIFSFVPLTTPFVMVMRLSQPAHEVAMWELLATIAVGFAGVAVVVWLAAKIFRVGVLMYGKPPSLLGLLKWIRHA